MRDDFPEDVKRTVAARVGNRCSRPDCRALTSGPQVDPSKALNVGVAAHITAASPGGPRFNPSLTSKERRSANNAIWLCQNCGKLVDNDQARFTEGELRRWKQIAEAEALSLIGKTAMPADPLHEEFSPQESINRESVAPSFGIITALSHEYQAVKVLLESTRSLTVPGRGAGRRYLYGEIPTSNGGRHPMVLALLPDMGNNPASSRATLLLEHFQSVHTVIMVGIAGGVPHPTKPDEHVRLGDVVVSDRQGVIQYDFDKETLKDLLPEIQHRHPPRPPSARLLESVKLFEANELTGNRPWLEYIDCALQRLSITRPSDDTDILASSTNPEEAVPHPEDPRRISGQPRVFSGPIASANKLLKNPLKRDELRDLFRVKAVEMEGSGIADAAWNAEAAYLVVRGICDYCDQNKGDSWQKYAAAVAAAYIRALLESTPAQPSTPSMPGKEETPAESDKSPEAAPHDYKEPKLYLPRKVCKAQDAGPFSLYLLNDEKLHDLAKVIERQKRVVLLCDAGAGKSTESERIAAHFSKEGSRLHTDLIPLNKYVNESLPDLLCAHWNQVPDDRLLIVLDGFDEIESQNRKSAVRRIESFAEKHPEAHILISCRTNFYNRESEHFSGTLKNFHSYTLLDLEQEVVDRYLDEKLGERKRAFKQAISYNELYDHLRSPFYLVRLVELFQESGSLPKTKAGIFEDLVQHSLKFDTEHFRTTDDLTEKRRSLIEALERLTLAMETFGRNYISDDEYRKIILDESSRELVKHCSLWKKEEKETLTWQFEHNNFQEYLAAKVLARQPLEVIKGFVSFEPAYPKIIPSWINTLTFLISIVDQEDPLFRSLFEWLKAIEPEIIVKFERDKIDSSTRLTYFKQIFNESQGREIDGDKFSFRELARFGQSSEAVKFLLTEGEKATDAATLANAIHLLQYLQIPHSYKERTIDFLVTHAISADQDSYVRHIALGALADLGLNSKEVLERVVPVARLSDDHSVKSGLYYLLLSSGQFEDYIEVFIEGIGSVLGSAIVGSGRHYLGQGLDRAKTPRAVKLILSGLIEHISSWERRSLDEHIPVIINNAASAYTEDSSIFYSALVLLASLIDKYNHKEAAVVAKFFTLTGTRLDAFRQVLDLRVGGKNWFDFLAMLADEECLEYFAQNYVDGKLADPDVWAFQNSLGYLGSGLFNTFNALINEKSGGKFVLPPARDYQQERKERHERDFRMLFDKKAFLAAVEYVFAKAKKEELTDKDLLNLFMEREKHQDQRLSLLALQVLNEMAEKNGEIVTQEQAVSSVENNWEQGSIAIIYKYLMNSDDLVLTEEQRERIVKWCESHVREVNFKKALTTYPNSSFSVDPLASYLWLFQRRLNLQFPEDVMLDMLSFESFDCSELKGIEYFEHRLDQASMTERVLENLEEGINNSYVLKNHLGYCCKHSIQEAIPFALREIRTPRSDSWGRHAALETVCCLPDAKSNLEQQLPLIKDNFKWQIVRQLIDRGSEKCVEYLHDLLANGDEDERLRAAMYLTEAQDLDGLNYYAEYIEKSRLFPEGPSEKTSFGNLQTIGALPALLRLLKVSFSEDFVRSEINWLYHPVIAALDRIAVISHENYRQVKESIEAFIRENQSELTSVKNLEQYLSRLEKLFYANLSQNLTLDDVLAKLNIIDKVSHDGITIERP
jgi:nucleoside phosphorylase/predicted NACHT family NTPase